MYRTRLSWFLKNYFYLLLSEWIAPWLKMEIEIVEALVIPRSVDSWVRLLNLKAPLDSLFQIRNVNLVPLACRLKPRHTHTHHNAYVTKPGLFLPTAQKAKHQDDKIAAEGEVNHKAAMWRSESMSIKSASPKIGTQGYLCERGQGGLKCGGRWLQVRRGANWWSHKRSQTPRLFMGPMFTKRQH